MTAQRKNQNLWLANEFGYIPPKPKLTHHWHGPFWIVEKCSPVHFRLRTCESSFAKPSVIVLPAATQSVPAAPPTPTETVHNIEKIVKQRTRKGIKQYLVKWGEYSLKHNSWVDEHDIVHTDTDETDSQ